MGFDTVFIDFMQSSLRIPPADAFFSFITHLGDSGAIWIITGIILLFFKKTRAYGLILLFCLAAGAVIGNLTLKPLFARQRPFETNPSVALLIKKPSGYSFPSGHTLSSFAGAAALFYMNKKAGAAAYLLASLIAFSRLYLYVHYPTDIIAGIAIGTAISLVIIYICKRVRFVEKINSR